MVLILISILAAIAVGRLHAARKQFWITAMRSDLKNLATKQLLHHQRNGQFTEDTGDLQFVTSQGVLVEFELHEDLSGEEAHAWTAEAEHTQLGEETCAAYFGTLDEDDIPSTEGGLTPTVEGVPVCDGSGNP